jgi:hypothetical protein
MWCSVGTAVETARSLENWDCVAHAVTVSAATDKYHRNSGRQVYVTTTVRFLSRSTVRFP